MIVVDTSVAVKWLNEVEADRDLALALYINHIEHKEEIIVPPLFYIECANALATKNKLAPADIKEALEFLYRLKAN